jgi:SRSO17 transposase
LQLEQWLLIEWAAGAAEPSGYWLACLPGKLSLKRLVGISKHRWVMERDYKELKQKLGLVTMKAATGGDFTTTEYSVSRLTVS